MSSRRFYSSMGLYIAQYKSKLFNATLSLMEYFHLNIYAVYYNHCLSYKQTYDSALVAWSAVVRVWWLSEK